MLSTEEVRKRKLKVAVVGIPKTIDNDVPLIDKSFGFDTAVEESQRAIRSALVEAKSGVNGMSLQTACSLQKLLNPSDKRTQKDGFVHGHRRIKLC